MEKPLKTICVLQDNVLEQILFHDPIITGSWVSEKYYRQSNRVEPSKEAVQKFRNLVTSEKTDISCCEPDLKEKGKANTTTPKGW